uniref:Uncharacterized protein n=1 Tax=Anguilla anguilla TaxID=7936 RepID=A0A0E9PZ20_ANGAN
MYAGENDLGYAWLACILLSHKPFMRKGIFNPGLKGWFQYSSDLPNMVVQQCS